MTTIEQRDYMDGYQYLVNELDKVLVAMEEGNLYKAEDIFAKLVEIHPDW